MSSARPRRVLLPVSAMALLLLVAWIGWNLEHPPAGVSTARLSAYLLPATAFLAGFHAATRSRARAVCRRTGIRRRWRGAVPAAVAGASLLGATQLPRIGVMLHDKAGTWLLALCIWLALWAGMLARQLHRHALRSLRGRGRASDRRAERLIAAVASAAGLVGATAAWVGFVSGSEFLVRHACVCVAAALARIVAWRAGRSRRSLAMIVLGATWIVALDPVRFNPGVSRPLAFAAGLVLASAVAPARPRDLARLLVVVTAGLLWAFVDVSAPGGDLATLADVRVALAGVSGALLAAACAAQTTLQSRPSLSDTARDAVRLRVVFWLVAFVVVATLWMTGLVWAALAPGSGLLLVAGLLAAWQRDASLVRPGSEASPAPSFFRRGRPSVPTASHTRSFPTSSTRLIGVAIAAGSVTVVLLLPWPVSLLIVGVVLAVSRSGAAVSLPDLAGVARGRGGKMPVLPDMLDVAAIDADELIGFFGGELPDNWTRQMSGVLDVLESLARPGGARLLDRAAVRTLWAAGPAPILMRAGTRLLDRYRTVVLTSDVAVGGSRTLVVVLTDGEGAQLELDWNVEHRASGIARTLTSAAAS